MHAQVFTGRDCGTLRKYTVAYKTKYSAPFLGHIFSISMNTILKKASNWMKSIYSYQKDQYIFSRPHRFI